MLNSKALAELQQANKLAKMQRQSLKTLKLDHLSKFPTIIQYLDKKGLRWDRTKKIDGVLIAWKSRLDGKIYFGWSKCDKEDKFTKDDAFYLALQRSGELPLSDNAPYNVKKGLVEFAERAKKYFKVSSL